MKQDDRKTDPESPPGNQHVGGDQKRAKDEYESSMDYNKHLTLIQFGHISVFLAAMMGCMGFFYGKHPPN